jgi:hypothetical protein
VTKLTLNLGNISLWMLAANTLASDVAANLMQLQRNREPLLPCHLTIPLNLFFQCRRCSHGLLINPIFADDNSAPYRLEHDAGRFDLRCGETWKNFRACCHANDEAA